MDQDQRSRSKVNSDQQDSDLMISAQVQSCSKHIPEQNANTGIIITD